MLKVASNNQNNFDCELLFPKAKAIPERCLAPIVKVIIYATGGNCFLKNVYHDPNLFLLNPY